MHNMNQTHVLSSYCVCMAEGGGSKEGWQH